MNELRKYIRKILGENILKEYLTNDTVALKQYFSMTDEQHKQYLPEQFSHFFRDFLIEEGIEFEVPKKTIPSDYLDEPDVEVDQFEDDSELMYWLEKNNKELYDRFANYLFTRLKENTLPIPEADVPAWSYFDGPQLVKNQWLIHFTKDARSIALEGFKYGVNEIDRLGLTTSIGEFEKKYGGYNFAYLLSDFQRYAYKGYGKYKYGDEAVIFRASGIKLWHHGDEEPQVIFYGNTATDIIPITEGESKKWAIRSAKTLNVVFEDDELQRVVYWIDRNYDQYRKSLRESVERKKLNEGPIWNQGGIILIKGEQAEGGPRLYATAAKNLIEIKPGRKPELGPLGEPGTPGSHPVKMAILEDMFYRIKYNNEGELRAFKVDWKNEPALAKMLNFKNHKLSVVLNNNKTPLHWNSLQFNNVGKMLRDMSAQIVGINDVNFF